MSSNDIVISVKNISKRFEIYDRPFDRLKQFLLPKIQKMLGMAPRQYFREFRALDDVSFEVKKGETVGVIGRNGSGKSTLLQLICGTLNPTSGSVETRGRIAALLELGSGFNPEFTGRENVYMNAAVLGLSREEIDGRFHEIVAFADIGDFIEQPVKTYSSGMMVRLAFAVIAHVDADILVIDEALAVGDAFFTQKCMRFLRSFIKNGTILFVSHDTGSVQSLCQKAIWLDSGLVKQLGSPKQVCETYLRAFYEAQQGGSGLSNTRIQMNTTFSNNFLDQRRKFINNSNLRNDIEIFEFSCNDHDFGKGAAQIVNAAFLSDDGVPLSWIVGGEKVTLSVVISVQDYIVSPIVGFFVRNRLGQDLFGDNTYLSTLGQNISCKKASNLICNFSFYMPVLPLGDYSVTIAVAEGTQNEHVQHHWIHDAILFKSQSTSVTSGLIGIPMIDIKLEVIS